MSPTPTAVTATGSTAARRTVKVTRGMVEAAQAQVEISRQLGRPVSKVVAKIAQAR